MAVACTENILESWSGFKLLLGSFMALLCWHINTFWWVFQSLQRILWLNSTRNFCRMRYKSWKIFDDMLTRAHNQNEVWITDIIYPWHQYICKLFLISSSECFCQQYTLVTSWRAFVPGRTQSWTFWLQVRYDGCKINLRHGLCVLEAVDLGKQHVFIGAEGGRSPVRAWGTMDAPGWSGRDPAGW